MRLGPWEIALIVGVALLVFGPGRLPQLGTSVAQFLKNFKGALKDEEKVTQEVKASIKS